MNKEQMTQEQRAQLIEKLRAEYNDLNGKIARLNAFLCDIDFVKKVPDPIEQELMSMQFRSMKGYLENLRGRIMFQDAQQRKEKIAEHLEHEQREFMPVLEKMNKTFQLPASTNIAQEKFEAFQKGEISLQEFLESVPCNESFLKAVVQYLTDEQHHCGQDACCQVDDGNAVVDKPIITGESLEQLVGATVRLFHKPGHKCIDCPYSSKSYGGKCEYKKVELVGGYYICLAPLPNSIVTE